ncbi:hypothetical protein [Anaeromicrobium sediminis]|uniref:Transcriptional regulator n=1 Tax=Anaeromicrobium sediminis TaxID=1478221 RepID=A0A267MJ18_9FIRM|nr:hypothetical protein [Anaeromicrobium sediminis]PAB59584.1 hypothetical protein CCE28_10265 [Anaeromicrobium sediminis]
MKIKLGIIGPEDSVEKICNVAREFTDKIEIFRFVYERKNETVHIITRCQKEVDVVLFSGHIPYYIAKYANVIKKPTFYIPKVGTSILKVFFEMHRLGIDYTKLSIDSINEEALEEVIDEMDIKLKKYYVIPYEENIEYEKLADKHYKLWKEGKVNLAVTGLSKTCEALKEKGVPVFKLGSTTFLIREYISKAIYEADVKKIKDTQVAIQIVKIKNKNKHMSSEYKFLKLKNNFEKALIEYTKSVLGSIFPFGRDEYMLFSTRGVMEASCKSLDFHRYVKVDSNEGISYASGIGYGNTVYNAECNARIALDYAIKKDESCIYIVEEDGGISGPIYDKNQCALEYKLVVDDKEIQEIAQKVKVSSAYISKIISIKDKTNKDTFDAREIANHLEISTRSARRILTNFLNAGFAAIVAKESNAKTGRPRQIYKIMI